MTKTVKYNVLWVRGLNIVKIPTLTNESKEQIEEIGFIKNFKF
jgi:hypothetical protein